MRVLVVAAHADDETLGCGGTIARLIQEGHQVCVQLLCQTRNDAILEEFVSATRALGNPWFILSSILDQTLDTMQRSYVAYKVEGALKEQEPELVLTHAANDRNLDHRIVHDAVLTACRPVNGCTVKKIMCFEVPSSTEWGGGFHPNVFVDVSGEPWRKKMTAWRCYRSEMRDYPHPRSLSNLEALSMLRGCSAGVDMAEAFELVREVL